MNAQRSVHDLKTLVLSFHSLIVVETVEEERVRAILAEVAADLRLPVFEWSVATGFHRMHGSVVGATHDALAVLKHIRDLNTGDAVFLLKDLAPHLVNNAAASRELREVATKLTATRSAIVVTGDPVDLPRDLETLAVRFELQLPDQQELRGVVRSVVDTVSSRQHVDVELTRDDAKRLVEALSGLTVHQARRVVAQAIVYDNKLAADDIDRIIRAKGQLIEQGSVLEFLPLEQNQFELSGFARLKQWLLEARAGFSPEAKAMNLHPPKGVLLVGVQGCGKSLAAKCIARDWHMPLLKFDASRLYDKYVGETEKNFRRATKVAEAMAPVVLWIDEIEKAFAPSSGGDADGGLSQRLFGSFLTWLQEKNEQVFVVGAANDLSKLPPELLRKGRFDEIFFVDLPDRSERMNIFTIHLRLRKHDPAKFDLARLADAADGFSGSEIEQAVVVSLYRTLHRRQPLTTESLLESVSSTVPLSTSRGEDLQRLRMHARGRFTPVA
ncbi:MAG TPA: AAA family ATPase [Thermoanaerobaculia bacterium]|jgi:hypothetical protein